MSRIRFLSRQVYDTGAPGKGPVFEEGRILDSSEVASVLGLDQVSDEYAAGWLRRWVSRNAAVFVSADEVEKQDDTPAEDGETDLKKLNRAQLDALAAEKGIDAGSAKTKAEVMALIEAQA
jgi:hypothetical protein